MLAQAVAREFNAFLATIILWNARASPQSLAKLAELADITKRITRSDAGGLEYYAAHQIEILRVLYKYVPEPKPPLILPSIRSQIEGWEGAIKQETIEELRNLLEQASSHTKALEPEEPQQAPPEKRFECDLGIQSVSERENRLCTSAENTSLESLIGYFTTRLNTPSPTEPSPRAKPPRPDLRTGAVRVYEFVGFEESAHLH
ncbi:hypothetical protein F5Y11DRAFT_365303 [Daldinia sp. FL1419]|nr:hypothetical protein F5Y11DRAFT_365303 [Daldinia sp. FL1419]